MKNKILSILLLVLFISVFLVGCNNKSNNDDEYTLLRNTYGKEITEPQITVIEKIDDSWEFYGTIHQLNYIPNDSVKVTTDVSMKSPLLIEELNKSYSQQMLFRIEVTCAYWETEYFWINKLPNEQQDIFYDSYKAFMAYHNAGLLPALTQIIFKTENNINRPLKIIGLWTKDEILNFESNCNLVFNGLDDYISIHLTTK